MEGPSIVIACEEFRPFLKKMITRASGTANLPFAGVKGSVLKKAESWGKHLLLTFSNVTLRIHFLMFGSYRIDDPRENRKPKLWLGFDKQKIYFYSCAIKPLDPGWRREYDWSIDLMSKHWNAKKAVQKIRSLPDSQVADLLMDQAIFAGLGNIMKNEILFRLSLHPETQAGQLTARRQAELVKEAETYAWLFYEWKKKNILKRNWRIMRKKICPFCGGRVSKRQTGRLQRWSHYCPRCQPKVGRTSKIN